ncbi:hypothetical protein EYB45_06360 [Erythrobacteraceae bacterium CFH 75059]|uniref:hypothetical protein n=1 Tax=Qipengyuania thermophila TaxID=2509361 RepID=UPI00101FD9ED|nr:hypothetical protein [Qipengyuania thermophila]TCD05123.1 hypothetical protein EYB45_06360 [Erythrobacteraceae bacterium CFH 75059]
MRHDDHKGRSGLVEDAKAELSAMAKGGLQHPSTKPVLAGAAIGALAGALLPVVTLPFGLVAGAGYAFYNRIKR